MSGHIWIVVLGLAFMCMTRVCAEKVYACDSQIYCQGRLLDTIQHAGLFTDSKTFVDMNLKFVPGTVEAVFNSTIANGVPAKAGLQEFVDNYFEGPANEFQAWTPGDYVENPSFLANVKDANLKQFGKHLCAVWEELGRQIKGEVNTKSDQYSLLYVENPFIVPGGRFRETYYWDSLWVVDGLLRCEMKQTVKGMLQNFFSIVQRYGLVPNGFRIYYTRRSQPPLLTWMVDSYYQSSDDLEFVRSNLPLLEQEYNFWMTNRSTTITKGGKTYTLNRYSTVHNQPRPESYSEDVETAINATDEVEKRSIYSNLASAAESGWDFSSRWFLREPGSEMNLASTVIKDILPVDLNSILCKNSHLLAHYFNITDDNVKYRDYMEKYEERKAAIHDVMWNADRGVWLDYHIPTQAHRDYFYPSNIFPMYADCYGNSLEEKEEMEAMVVKYLKDEKIESYEGGIPTSKEETGQQWDFPNAWPPLQHAVITSLAHGDMDQSKAMAKNLAQIWVYTNWLGWNNTRNMFEKYDVTRAGRRGGGGEYGVQTGFGWTNGVVLDLLSRYGDTLTTKATPTSTSSTFTVSHVCVILVSVITTLSR